jgi:hypothetical protein
MTRFLFVFCILFPLSLAAQQAGPMDVKVPVMHEKDRYRSLKDAKLTLDDGARRLVIASNERPLDVGYDAVRKVIIEPDNRVEHSFWAAVGGFAVGGILFGPSLGAAINNPLKMAHSVYLEYSKPDGTTLPFVFGIGKDTVPFALKRIYAAFGERVQFAAFAEAPEKLEKDTFKSAKTKCEVRATLEKHPLPELLPDKALVVISCPARDLGAARTDKWSRVAGRIVINDEVVAVNGPGTFTYLFLDPGEYLLVSIIQNAVGLGMKLEAGKDYYLIQQMYIAGNIHSLLTRHSKELVMYEMNDLMWPEWRPAK